MAGSRFVVLCLQGFGDALEATPLVDHLRKYDADAHITIVTMRAAVRDLFAAMPALADRVLYVPYWERGAGAALAAALRLPLLTRSDASFVAFPSARSEYGALAWAIGSRTYYAHDYPRAGTLASFARRSSRRVPIAPKHNVLRNLDLLAAAGIPVDTPAGYTVPDAWRAPRTASERVLLHLGSIAHDGLENKRWPPERFLELARELQRSALDVAFISGPAERDVTARVARDAGGARIFEGSLPEIARIVAASGAVVANDNGIAHLAAGVGTPVIALMGPTPREFGPYGASAIAYRPSACPPCFDIVNTDARCVLDIDYACLKKDIRVADVAAQTLQLMNMKVPG